MYAPSDRIREIVDFHLCSYKDYVDEEKKKSPVLVQDPVHGSMRFGPFERKVMNLPFLQRLKNIKQMGLCYLVYPDAMHSRFGHSLGASHVGGRISDTVSRKVRQEAFTEEVRVALILHDIGIGPFSHVSDRVYELFNRGELPVEKFPEVRSLVESHIKNVHELLTSSMMEDSRFKAVLEEYVECSVDMDALPRLVTGDPEREYKADPSLSVSSKIVNGFMDADKIDYIMRDSHFTGLPLPIDVDRLISFLTMVEGESHGETMYDLGVEEKAARCFEILLRAKAMMFPTVYHHHTTRGCEGMLLQALKYVLKSQLSSRYEHRQIKSPLDLLYFDNSQMIEYLKRHEHPIPRDVIARLRTRWHYRVAFDIKYWYFYKKYTEGEAGQILDNMQDKLKSGLEFKAEILKKGNANLRTSFPDLRDLPQDELVDYAIFVDMAEPPTERPYVELHSVVTEDIMTYEKMLVSLQDMGFVPYDTMQGMTDRVYCLPEIRSEVQKGIREILDELIKKWVA